MLSELNNQNKTRILIRESHGIERCNEPVTTGVPFPEGKINELSSLSLVDNNGDCVRFQSSVLATWPDQSIKWGLFDFQASVSAADTLEIELVNIDNTNEVASDCCIKTEATDDKLVVDTGAAVFTLDKKEFKPFVSVIVDNQELINSAKTFVQLTDHSDNAYEPVIDHLDWETDGPIRKTLKIDGHFPDSRIGGRPIHYRSRIYFFVCKAYCKIDFTLLNPNPASHPGGLWDLGDPGSFLFSDLSIMLGWNKKEKTGTVDCVVKEDTSMASNSVEKHRIYDQVRGNHLTIYQDSSGGEQWNCSNHVNRDNEVRHRFKGFRLFSDNKVLFSGRRALPVISLGDEHSKISGAIKNFWQNCPKVLEGKDNTIFFRLFPAQYDDFFELQGGEQKTHTLFMSFGPTITETELNWIDFPLIASADPQTFAQAGVFPYLVPDVELENKEILDLVNTAVEGDRSFFKRREIIDEYGWRNFGELYADHEAVESKTDKPFISHYNNQYDCINGFLTRFAASGDERWFILADQLCCHVKDIDIYHTNDDRPEFNHGLFWHTNHHKDAGTGTHRCYSKLQVEPYQLSNYGGGPALSHCYTSGLLNHFYMTGDYSSKETVMMITEFTVHNYKISRLILMRSVGLLKKISHNLKIAKNRIQRVNTNKIYNLNGPGRASGNALNTLIDAFTLTENYDYLNMSEVLIRLCIHPNDKIYSRDLMDIENRWMYTIFLQALIKYLMLKQSLKQFDSMWNYSLFSCINYSRWIFNNEKLYLEQMDKLDFPNETWPAQDFRKICILKFSQNYIETEYDSNQLKIKVEQLSQMAIAHFKKFDTRYLTRPLILMLNYALHYINMNSYTDNNKYLIKHQACTINRVKKYKAFGLTKIFSGYSCIMEWNYAKWHVFCILKRLRS